MEINPKNYVVNLKERCGSGVPNEKSGMNAPD